MQDGHVVIVLGLVQVARHWIAQLVLLGKVAHLDLRVTSLEYYR